MHVPLWLKANKRRHMTLAIFAMALFAFGVLISPRGYACAQDTAPSDYCYYTNVTVTYTGAGTITDQAVRAEFNGADLIATDTINDLAWDLRPYIGVVSNEVNVEAQSLMSNTSGFWFQIPEISADETLTIRQLMGSNEQKRDQGVLMTGGETITTPDDDALDLLDMFTARVSLILLDDTARNETIAEHHDGSNGWRIDLVDNAGSLEVQCTVDATTVSIAFNAAWVDTTRDFACELDSLGDGLTITEEVSGTTASTAAGPIDSAVAVDLIVGDDSLDDAIVLDFQLQDDRVRMSSLGVPTVVIDRFTLASASASETLTVDTSNLPFTPRHLMLQCNVQASTATPSLVFRLNGNSGAVYNYQELSGVGGTAAAARTTGGTSGLVGVIGSTANVYSASEVLFPDALSTRSHKSYIALNGYGETAVYTVAGRYASTAAVSNVTVFASSGNMAAGSTCDLAVVDERYAVDEQILTVAGALSFDYPNRLGYGVLIGNLRTSAGGAGDTVEIEINGDSTAGNYSRQQLEGSGAGTAASSASDNRIGVTNGNGATADAFGAALLTFSNGNGSNDPHVLSLTGNHASAASSNVYAISLRRDNVERLDTVALTAGAANFVANSGAWLYFVPTTVQEVVTLDAAAASITFSGIEPAPAARVSLYGRGDNASATINAHMTFNGDTTAANYDLQDLSGDGGTVTASQSASDETVFTIPAASATSNIFGGGVAWIPNYAASDRHKARLSLMGAAEDIVVLTSSRWEDNSPITSATLTASAGDFDVGTQAMLETVDGFGTVVRYGYDANSMTESTAVDPTYIGTFDGYGLAALTANYSFTRDQSDFQINVGPLIPANVNPGPVDPDELLDILGDPFGDLIDEPVVEQTDGIFYDYFVIPVDALAPEIGRQFAWTLIMGGAAIVFMVFGYMAFARVTAIQTTAAVFMAGIPLVYGATQGYISWWWVLLWMVMVPVAWFATKQAQET